MSTTQRSDLRVVSDDPYLEPFRGAVAWRREQYGAARAHIETRGGLTGQISSGHQFFGFNRAPADAPQPGVWYREWAPGAQALYLTGDFNDWSRDAHPLTRDDWGVWSLFLPDSAFAARLTHGSRLKVRVVGADGVSLDRIPAYIRRVIQETEAGDFVGQYWMPPDPYAWTSAVPQTPAGEGLRIYETHVGMAQEAARVGTYDEFTDKILPRIAHLGYNAIQLMAIQEHPYYGSFGYHVSSLFAPSSRFGTPEQLKRLIDTAHGLGLRVLLDIVHSHAVKNLHEGLNRFDGTDYQYFHAGERGQHPAWDSLLFDYAKYEVQRLLLSNIRYWLDEFRFDGFRFDGVTSMIYRDHGLKHEFTSYDHYFGGNIDDDAVLYLQLANALTHELRPDAITIAEEVSGLPGLARPIDDGGLGFDYRLAMGVPDYWIKLLKERRDEDWNLGEIYGTLLNRRWTEKHVGYVESHDQALVGDKTLAFQLMDAEMYRAMAYDTESPVVDRGIALHKMLRLLTFSLSGDAYLTFMGNEFGHPEWVDFPREGNGWSYQFARRQWSIADNPSLRYSGLNAFEPAMLGLDREFHLLRDSLIEQLALHEDTRQLVYRRGPLVFAFNFHPTQSYANLRIPVPDPANYRVVLSTDDREFAGLGRVARGTEYPQQRAPMYGREQSVEIYLPARTAQVLAPVS
jgi:1,4-alpha-glucan branching enzyme